MKNILVKLNVIDKINIRYKNEQIGLIKIIKMPNELEFLAKGTLEFRLLEIKRNEKLNHKKYLMTPVSIYLFGRKFEDSIIIKVDDFNDSADIQAMELIKKCLYKKLREMLTSGKYTSFISVSEAWMSDSDSTNKGKMPCECDDAQDIIMITYQTEFGQGGFIWIPFKIRNDRVIFHREISGNYSDSKIEGKLFNLWR